MCLFPRYGFSEAALLIYFMCLNCFQLFRLLLLGHFCHVLQSDKFDTYASLNTITVP